MNKDRYLAIAVLLMVIMLFIESGNIPDKMSWQSYGSALYPQILLGIIGITATIILFKSFISTVTIEQDDSKKIFVFDWRVIGIFAIFGSYAAFLPILGYLASTMAFMVAVQAILFETSTLRKWAVNIFTSGSITLLVYIIFKFGLNVWLP
ncbi:MAG: tripartite tricarboxylate transporter TctB family protein [Oceanisphaera sp.]|uniref:tripartite tricarboxylate transporter TctB family protein n=1 Tax=Oceanisphaera sp. TaxID=1929979 RepID=UPI003C78829E